MFTILITIIWIVPIRFNFILKYSSWGLFISIETSSAQLVIKLRILKAKFLTVHPHGSKIMSLATGQGISGSIPGSIAVHFSRGELFHLVRAGCFFLCVLYPCSVLYFLRRRPMHSTDHRSEEALELCPCSCMQLVET